MHSQTLDLSIVVVNYNSRDHLRKCIRSIKDSARGFTYEVIVVDNASYDGSAEMMRAEFPDIRLIANKDNVGFSRANNQGARVSRGRYVLLLNNDTLVLPEALKTMTTIMDGNPGIGLLGCRLLNTDGTLQQSFYTKIGFVNDFFRKYLVNLYEKRKNPIVGKYLEWRHSKPREVGMIKGACMFLRRQAFFDIDLMDENFFMFFEEGDLSLRIKRLGWKIFYTPEAEIVHFGGVSTAANSYKSEVEYRRSQLYFYQKHYGRGTLALIKVYLYCKLFKNHGWCFLTDWLGFKSSKTSEEIKRFNDDVLAIIRSFK
ncbi:MAG: glycosyltransferase family 2 protein [Nitrospinae bacterium]|nr:glycosyltransferase family 2 protein [Nitrospinota bacterium]